MDFKRVIVVVLDGVGAGEAPDAALYGDVGSNSLANTAKAVGGLRLPNMAQIGLGHVTDISGVPPTTNPTGAFGRMAPQSAGKDTISGHWELMGICLSLPFPTYPNGFPEEIIAEFRERTGKDILGNKAASGTEIIKERGLEHIRTGKPIVYTSADSVFQIAAHEKVIPIDELYHLCEISRGFLVGKHAVGRVIARPFLGDTPDTFWRTPKRKDYSLKPPSPTAMDNLVEAGKDVYTVGKIDDIFGGRGITKSRHTTNNDDSTKALLDFLMVDFEGLLFVNLIEFDMVFGHRNDPQGYARALEAFDKNVPDIIRRMKWGDICMIVADHGVDPTTPGTDHSREYIPLLVFGERVRAGTDLDTRKTFSDVAATISEIFSLTPPNSGESFLQEITVK